MATRRRIAAWLIVVAGCLLAAVVFLAPVFFDPDRYRPEAISYFEENTGRKVEIERLALTFFPKVNGSHRRLWREEPSVISSQLHR